MMDEARSADCKHVGSLFLDAGEGGGYQVVCGQCWILGPERGEPSEAIRAFRELEGPEPEPGRAA